MASDASDGVVATAVDDRRPNCSGAVDTVRVERATPVLSRGGESSDQTPSFAVYDLGRQFVSGLSTVFDDHLRRPFAVPVHHPREGTLGADDLYLLA